MFWVGKEAGVADVQESLQHRPKDQDEKLIEANLIEEGKEVQPNFVSSSLLVHMK